jgi:4-aminobutyrate aminotransferase
MIGVELVKDRETKERAGDWRDQVIQQAFRKGLLLLGCGQNTLRICPALTVTSEEADVFLTIFEESLRELFK